MVDVKLTKEQEKIYEETRTFLQKMGVSKWRQFLNLNPKKQIFSLDEIAETAKQIYSDLSEDEIKKRFPEILGKTYIAYSNRYHAYKFNRCRSPEGKEGEYYSLTVEEIARLA